MLTSFKQNGERRDVSAAGVLDETARLAAVTP